MEFSKKMLVLHICISVLLCITTIVGDAHGPRCHSHCGAHRHLFCDRWCLGRLLLLEKQE